MNLVSCIVCIDQRLMMVEVYLDDRFKLHLPYIMESSRLFQLRCALTSLQYFGCWLGGSKDTQPHGVWRLVGRCNPQNSCKPQNLLSTKMFGICFIVYFMYIYSDYFAFI